MNRIDHVKQSQRLLLEGGDVRDSIDALTHAVLATVPADVISAANGLAAPLSVPGGTSLTDAERQGSATRVDVTE